MKNIAFIYSGDDTGLNSLEHNRNGVASKLKDFGNWEIAVNKKLDSELTFIKDIQKYQNDEIDNFLIYYTGHGEMPEPFKTFQMKISDVQGIPLETLYSKVFQCFTKDDKVLPLKLAIVLDACYSGDTVYEAKQFGTSEIVASSLAGKESFEVGFPTDSNGNVVKSKMSLFSHYFCEAIEELQNQFSNTEDVTLLNIRNYINGFVKLQTSPYSFKSIYDEQPMSIAKGSKNEEYLGDIEIIYVRFYLGNSNYEVIVNGDSILTVNVDKVLSEETQQKVIDKINSLITPFTSTRIELILPKELYGEVFPLWRENITANFETVICSLYKEEMSDKWLPQLQTRWKNSFDRCKNMSFGNKDVSTRVEDETMQHPQRISVIIEKKVENPKVFDGIEDYYFIALWVNECDMHENYINLINEVSKEKLCEVPMKLRDNIVANPKSCISNLNFMWDDPYTLPKQGRRKE